jgi:rRNA maturation protein Rpf1
MLNDRFNYIIIKLRDICIIRRKRNLLIIGKYKHNHFSLILLGCKWGKYGSYFFKEIQVYDNFTNYLVVYVNRNIMHSKQYR